MNHQGKPSVVKNPYAKSLNPYAKTNSSLNNAATKRLLVTTASSLHPKTPVAPLKLLQQKPEKQQPPNAVAVKPTTTAPNKTEQRTTDRKVPIIDGKKNPPSLKVKLKKEIEDLKRQQQRQKERLEAERHRRKLEKLAERRKQAEQQHLPTPAAKSTAGHSHITPSPNSHDHAQQSSSASSRPEFIKEDFPATPFVHSKSSGQVSADKTEVSRGNDSLAHFSAKSSANLEQSSPRRSSHPTKEPVAPTWIPAARHEPMHPAQIATTSDCSNQPAENQQVSSLPPVMAPMLHTAPSLANSQTVAFAQASSPVLPQGTASTSSYSVHIQQNENRIPQANAFQVMIPMLNPEPMAPYSSQNMVANPFAQPMMLEAAFQNPYAFQTGFPAASQDAFHNTSWMPTWQQALYNLQQQQYYYGLASINPVGHFPGTMNPWVMTMAAASMGQALPQAQSVRRSANQSNKTTRQSQQDWRLISTPCRAPSPFARTHEILPHAIVMVKHSQEHKGFGVTLKKVAECALVGFEEWPMEELAPNEKTDRKDKQLEKTGASISTDEKVDEIMVDGASGEEQVQGANNNSNVAQSNEIISQELTETENPGGSIQENHHGVPDASQSIAVENKMDEGAPEAFKSIESNQSADAPEASEGSSSLAPTPSEVKVATLAAEITEKSETTSGKQERQPRRRRRLFFCVMQVLNASEQNKRSHCLKDSNMQLEEGDIILTIQGEETGRKSFDDAVKLFASVNYVGEDGFIQCVVTVARRKKVAPPPVRLPKYIPSIAKNGASLPLTEPEFRALATAMIELARNQHRLLGQSISSSLMHDLFQLCPLLSSRAPDFLVSSWEFITERIKREMRRRANEHWAAKWQSESVEIKASTKSHMSDAQRSSRRARPRPARGCRCGSQDHEYVNDANCPLYSNLRRLKQESSPEEVDPKTTRPKIKGPKDLNVVEKAFKERFIRMKEEEVALEAEATFVGEMESIQMKQCGMAIFAPGNLAAMVLSAAAELEPMFRGRQATQPVASKEPEVAMKDGMDDSDDDDDDVPLTSLGKRSSNDASLVQNKKKKAEPVIPLDYLVSLIRYICSRWGHVYREPSELDYAWRWEVYHGQFSLADSSNVCKNPRRAGALSLENISFVIDAALVNEVQQSDTLLANLPLDKLNAIAFAMLPSATGILDELYALVRSSILELNEAGIPKLASQWFSNVDVLLLDDMDSYWGIRADPTGKFGMSQQIRTTLHREWEKTDEGWILVVEDPYDVVYEFAVFDEWRDAFEDKEKTKADSIEGVGRFGI